MRQVFFFFLRHSILLLIIGYVLLGYIYRGPIFGWPIDGQKVALAVSPQEDPSPVAVEGEQNSSPSAESLQSDAEVPEAKREAAATLIQQDEEPTLSEHADISQLLERARALADRGDYLEAEVAYLRIIQRFPHLADAYGEMGNLYLAADQLDKAAQAYLEAAKRIDPQLHPSQIAGLLQTLETLAPEKAKLLREYLEAR